MAEGDGKEEALADSLLSTEPNAGLDLLTLIMIMIGAETELEGQLLHRLHHPGALGRLLLLSSFFKKEKIITGVKSC